MAAKKLWLVLGLTVALAACQTDIDEGVEVELTGNPDGGFTEREPDTCGAEDFQTALGQQQSVIPSLGVQRKIRIIAPGDIVTQEYNPLRMNFYVNASGVITRVTCG